MSLQTMLKMFTGSQNTSMQSQTPLSNGRRDDAMIKSCPFTHDALFQVNHLCSSRHVLVAHSRHSSQQD